ncbi:MAG: hypothetical protein ACP6IU_04045 [Candidatus Asgardarchaeia archaeon]
MMGLWDFLSLMNSNMYSIIIDTIMVSLFGAVAVLMEYTYADTRNYTHKIFALAFEIYVLNKVMEVIFNLFSVTGIVLPWLLPYAINTITLGFAIYLPITLAFLNKVYTKQWYYLFMVLGFILIILQIVYIGAMLPLDFSIASGLVTEILNAILGFIGVYAIVTKLKQKELDPSLSIYLFLLGFFALIIANVAPAIILSQALFGFINPYEVFGNPVWPFVQAMEVIIGFAFTLSLLAKIRGM